LFFPSLLYIKLERLIHPASSAVEISAVAGRNRVDTRNTDENERKSGTNIDSGCSVLTIHVQVRIYKHVCELYRVAIECSHTES
jgi:hypothetical protein